MHQAIYILVSKHENILARDGETSSKRRKDNYMIAKKLFMCLFLEDAVKKLLALFHPRRRARFHNFNRTDPKHVILDRIHILLRDNIRYRASVPFYGDRTALRGV